MPVKTVKPGDVVLVPFAFSDGTCEFCEKGLPIVCKHGGFWGMENDGGQGEAIRAPLADGAVGLCGVLVAKRIGATRIIAMGHHEGRLHKARAFGATRLVSSRGDEAVGEVMELTDGGAPHVLECVGATSAMETAIKVARPGGSIGYVGVPHGPAKDGFDIMTLFFKQLTLRGGGAGWCPRGLCRDGQPGGI